DTVFTVTYSVGAVERDGNRLKAHITSDYGGVAQERLVDTVVINRGTLPLDELYFTLKPSSANLGAVDYASLIAGRAQRDGTHAKRNPQGQFELYRIGDAVSARNTHAAIYDALRLVKDL